MDFASINALNDMLAEKPEGEEDSVSEQTPVTYVDLEKTN